MNIIYTRSFLLAISTCMLFSGFSVTKAQDSNSEIVIHEYHAPDKINPLFSNNSTARYLQYHLYNKLLEYDPKSLTLRPQLAVDRPIVKTETSGDFEGGMSIQYEIRPEATWDDGSQITGYDYWFTMKIAKNQFMDVGQLKAHYRFIQKIEVNKENPKQFTIYSKERNFLGESSTGELFILPEYFHDPKQIMRKYLIKDLVDPHQFVHLQADTSFYRYVDRFNESIDKEDITKINGSGAYELSKESTDSDIILTRKKDWWGDKLANVPSLAAKPQKITYKIIPYFDAAILAMVNKEIDVMRNIKLETFLELKDNKDFTADYNLYSPSQLAYYYIGFNLKSPKFQDKEVRKAFAHLLNRDEIIDVFYQGLAEKADGPINPSKPYYNKKLPNTKYNRTEAAKLLAKAGWKDRDGDGILDKEIEGKIEKLQVEYKYNIGNSFRRDIGLLLKDEARKVGIEVILEEREWSQFLEETRNREFDLFCLAWIQGHGLDDLSSIWHSDSDTPYGSNRISFHNEKVDKLLEEIKNTLDDKKIKKLYAQVQEYICDEYPYIFLLIPQERIAISKRFGEIETSVLRPGFHVQDFEEKK